MNGNNVINIDLIVHRRVDLDWIDRGCSIYARIKIAVEHSVYIPISLMRLDGEGPVLVHKPPEVGMLRMRHVWWDLTFTRGSFGAAIFTRSSFCEAYHGYVHTKHVISGNGSPIEGPDLVIVEYMNGFLETNWSAVNHSLGMDFLNKYLTYRLVPEVFLLFLL